MIRLLLIFLLGYFAWRAIRPLLNPDGGSGDKGGRDGREMDADLVQDPQCGVYVSREEALKADIDGRRIYFCSQECKQKYLEKH